MTRTVEQQRRHKCEITRRWYRLNKERRRVYKRVWRQRNRERINQRQRVWRQHNIEACRARTRQWDREKRKRERDALTDGYVETRILKMRKGTASRELLEAKRQQLQVRRLLRSRG